jgi:hypothetical protein
MSIMVIWVVTTSGLVGEASVSENGGQAIRSSATLVTISCG